MTIADVTGCDPAWRLGFPRRSDAKHSVILDGVPHRARDFRRADEPAFTVTEKARSWVWISPTGGPRSRWVRAADLAEQDARRLQAFPADHPFAGSRTSRFLQLGNAIPPPLATAILERLVL